MVKPIDPDAWSALLQRQHGAVSLRQCRQHGVSADAALRAMKTHGWSRASRAVYVSRPGTPSPETRLWAALLGIGGHVVASHETSLWLDGIAEPPSATHLGVLDGRDVAPRRGVVVHHFADLSDERVLWGAEPPRIRLEQTVLDLSDQLAVAGAVIGLLTGVINKRGTTSERLALAADARPRLRHRALLQEVLGETAAGALSPLEVRDLKNDRLHGLPEGRRQAVRWRDGRVDVVDVAFEEGLRRPVIKELDGWLGHGEPRGRWRDMERDNAAEARGESHLRYGWRDLVERPCAVAFQVAAVLRANGWAGDLRPCSPDCTPGSMIRRT